MSMKFPKNFIFGVSEADLQIVGETIARKKEHSEETAWQALTHKTGRPPVDNAIERYSRWKEDMEWFKNLSVKHYRISISMSRTLHKNGSPNIEALTWYKNYFKALNKQGIKIYATLYHWEMPQYVYEKGGWLNEEIIELLKKHATVVYDYLNDYIEEYFIVNEPWCIAMLGHFRGIHAPFHTSLSDALLASHNVLRSIGAVQKTLKALNPRLKISTVYIVFPAYAGSADEKDMAAARIADGHYNRWFIDPLFYGEYPKDMLKVYKKFLPTISPEHMKEMAVGEELHALGINYYNGEYIRPAKNDMGYEYYRPEICLVNDLDWPIAIPPYYPEALYDVLGDMYHSYKRRGLRRIYISENGITLDTPWNGKDAVIEDNRRIHFVYEHLKQIYKARQAKIPVEGYFLWTLMDNYEWQAHYNPKSSFGLIHVERDTMKRIPKQSYYWYKKIIETGTV